MSRVTVASLSADVEALTKAVEALIAAQGSQDAPKGDAPKSRRNKPEAPKGALLPVGSTFEYRKGAKGKRQRWMTYEVVAHDGGRMAAMLQGSDSSFVSRWTPEALTKPYIRNVKSAS